VLLPGCHLIPEVETDADDIGETFGKMVTILKGEENVFLWQPPFLGRKGVFLV